MGQGILGFGSTFPPPSALLTFAFYQRTQHKDKKLKIDQPPEEATPKPSLNPDFVRAGRGQGSSLYSPRLHRKAEGQTGRL